MLELDGDASVVVGTLFDVADLGFLGGDVLVGERHLVAELDEYALGIVFVGLIVEPAYLGIGLADDVFFAVYFEGELGDAADVFGLIGRLVGKVFGGVRGLAYRNDNFVFEIVEIYHM